MAWRRKNKRVLSGKFRPAGSLLSPGSRVLSHEGKKNSDETPRYSGVLQGMYCKVYCKYINVLRYISVFRCIAKINGY